MKKCNEINELHAVNMREMMKHSRAEALYDLTFGEEFDETLYDTLEEAVAGEVDHEGGYMYEIDEGTYIVADESEAEALAIAAIQEMADEIGGFAKLSSATTTYSNFLRFVEHRHFELIELEELENDYELSMTSSTKDFTRSDARSYAKEHLSNDSIAWYIDKFGSGKLVTEVRRYDLVDGQAFSTFILESEGFAHVLAAYNGEEHQVEGWYIYRTN